MAKVKYKTRDEKGETSWYEQEVPDTATPQEIIDHVEGSYGRRVLELEKVRSLGEEVKAGAKDLARGFMRPGALLADTAVNPTGFPLFNARMGWKDPFATAPVLGEPHQAALRETLPLPGNESTADKLKRGVLEGVGGAAAMPMGDPARILLAGGLAGGSGALGSVMTGGNQLGELIGSLLGGTVATIGSAGRTNTPAVAAQALEGVSPEQLAAAKVRMEWMKGQGVPSNLSQGMKQSSNIDDVVAALANSRYGDETIANLRTQPEQLAVKARGALRGQPGAVSSAQDMANRGQEAATVALAEAKKRANAAYIGALEPGATVPRPMLELFERRLDELAAKNPTLKERIGMINEVKGRLRLPTPEPQAKPLGAGLISSKTVLKPEAAPAEYLTDPGKLWESVGGAIQGYGRNAINTGADAADLNRYAAEIREIWKDTVRKGTPGMERAAAASRSVYETEVNPMRKSVTGRVAGVSGASEVKEAVDKLTTLFAKGTPKEAKTSEILTFEKDIRAKHPGLFADAVATNLSERLNKLLPTTESKVSDRFAADIKAALFDNPAQERGIRDMLAGVARSKGLPEKPFVDGGINFFRLADLLAKRPQRVSGLPPLDLQRTAEAATITTPLRPGFELAQRVHMALSADAYRTMDKLLNDPEGIALLQRLAQQSVMQPAAQAAVASFLGATGQETEEPQGTIRKD